jgi:hypothetical protein
MGPSAMYSSTLECKSAKSPLSSQLAPTAPYHRCLWASPTRPSYPATKTCKHQNEKIILERRKGKTNIKKKKENLYCLSLRRKALVVLLALSVLLYACNSY